MRKYTTIKEAEAWRKQIDSFERWYLDPTGRYVGIDLQRYGFPYAPGEWVPIDKRYSATLQWNYAMDARLLAMRSAHER